MNDTLLRPLIGLVLKQGVGLGGLPQSQQTAVFALAWAGLLEGGATERQINELLKHQLAGALAFVDTDHVELRRWLVDAGWLNRDGYGHEYRRVPWPQLPEAGQAVAAALSSLDVAVWVAGHRDAHLAQRQARRQAWAMQQPSGDSPPAAPEPGEHRQARKP